MKEGIAFSKRMCYDAFHQSVLDHLFYLKQQPEQFFSGMQIFQISVISETILFMHFLNIFYLLRKSVYAFLPYDLSLNHICVCVFRSISIIPDKKADSAAKPTA